MRKGYSLLLSDRLILVAAALVFMAPIVVYAVRPGAGVPQTLATSVDGPSFEIISIRRNAPEDRNRFNDSTLASGHFRAGNQTLKWLISTAYAPITFPAPIPLDDDRVSGGPEWINKDRFTIEAKADRAVTGTEMAVMLRRLLAERFKLKVRVESRQVAGYELVRSKSGKQLGPNLRIAKGCESVGRQGIGGGPGRLALRCTPMPLLAEMLSEMVDRPIIDHTGLIEKYDGTLESAPTDAEILTIFRGERPPDGAATSPSIFTALQEQMGLKLAPFLNSVEYLLVEQAERPSEN